MKALVTTGDNREIVRLADVGEPSSAVREVMIEVQAFGVNQGEWRSARSRPEGSQIGWDVAGMVATLASDGTGPAKGARVVTLANVC
ncbi:alcohol dehydrogenase catalytic domain-containing protein [Nocardia gipuzkoensis]